MKSDAIRISKFPEENIFQLSKNSGEKNELDFKFSIDAQHKSIFQVSEMLRFMQTIEENKFSFTLENSLITDSKIPVINLVPDNVKDNKLPLVLFVHGFETSKEKVLRFGMHFASSGFYTALIDLPDHGDRAPADFDEKYAFKENLLDSWINRLILIKRSMAEIKNVIDHYSLESLIDKDRIGISGISMGGTLTLLTSYADSRIRAGASFLSILGYDSLPGLENSVYLPREKLEEIHSIDPMYAIKKMPAAAILAQFGELDEITDRPVLADFEKKLQEYYSGFPERFKIVREPRVRHDLNMPMIRNSVEWFKKHL